MITYLILPYIKYFLLDIDGNKQSKKIMNGQRASCKSERKARIVDYKTRDKVMLSLLSLLLASGTVLKADTDEWTPETYPDPRTNSTLCNTWENSTLCDPDHMLTDYWRNKINDNIIKQMEKLKESNIQYTEKSSISCLENVTEPVKIYVLLAKRIHTANNQTITGADLTNFGNELTQRFGFDQLPCKNFLLLIGIEAAKLAYVRTGKDLKLPADLMQKVFHEYNLFKANNYMEGLNKIVDEIGVQMTDPLKDLEELIKETTATAKSELSSTEGLQLELQNFNQTSTENLTLPLIEGETATTTIIELEETPWWIFVFMGGTILTAIFSLIVLCVGHAKRRKLLKISISQSIKPQIVNEKGTLAGKYSDKCSKDIQTDSITNIDKNDKNLKLHSENIANAEVEINSAIFGDTESVTERNTRLNGTIQRSTTPIKSADIRIQMKDEKSQ